MADEDRQDSGGGNRLSDHLPTLYVHTAGAGPEVVLAHGWGMHSGVWENVAEALIDDCRVTVVDLPGHGYSRGFGAGLTLAELAGIVAAAVPAPAVWVGWSLGGLIAQQVALTMPERVSRLALVNSTACFTQRPDWPHAVALPVLRRFADELRENHRAVLKRFIALEVHGSDHASDQYRQLKALLFQHGEPDPAALGDGLAILESADLRAELPRPAIHGWRDCSPGSRSEISACRRFPSFTRQRDHSSQIESSRRRRFLHETPTTGQAIYR